jgi:signal transduction histidine kinase
MHFAKRMCFLLFLPVAQLASAQSQSQDTTRLLALVTAAEKTMKTTSFEQVDSLGRKAMAEADSLGFAAGQTDCYDLLGLLNGFRGELDSAQQYFTRGSSLIADRQSEQSCRLTAHLGWIARLKGDYSLSSTLLYKALATSRAKTYTGLQAYACLQLGQISLVLHSPDSASRYYAQGLSLATEAGDQELEGNSYLALGEAAMASHKDAGAEAFFVKSEERLKQAGDLYDLSHVYNSRARLYLKKPDYVHAALYYKKSGELKKQTGDVRGLAVLYNNLGDLYAEEYKDKEAIASFKQSLDLASRIGTLDIQQAACLNLSILTEDAKDFPAALRYYKQYALLRDSLWSIGKTKEMLALEEKYHLSQKEKEILQLNSEQKESAARLREEKVQRNFFVTGSVLLAILAGLIYIGYRQKQAFNKVIGSQNSELQKVNRMKDHLFFIIGHDLRMPLSSLTRIAELVQYCIKNNKTEELIHLGNDIDTAVKKTDRFLGNLLLWALSQTGQLAFQPRSLALQPLLEQVEEDFVQELAQKGLQLVHETEPGLLAYADPNAVRSVFRNLLSNAVKFSPPNGRIDIISSRRDRHCFVQIKDQGAGIDPAKLAELFTMEKRSPKDTREPGAGAGLGLFICRQVIEMNKGTIHIDSIYGKGTAVSFTIPLDQSNNS